MEWVEGRPLTEATAGQPLELVAQLFQRTCEAVSFVHSKGVIHRDLKPSNILVTEDGEIKLIDFGVAMEFATAEGSGFTTWSADSRPGTLEYMSPEQARGEYLHIDERSDVYSLGVILFELLVGILPGQVMEKGKLPKMADVSLRSVPSAMDRVVHKALQSEPKSRYQSVPQLAAAVRKAFSAKPLLPKWLPALALTLLVFGIGAMLIFPNFHPKKEPPLPLPPPPPTFHTAKGSPFNLVTDVGQTQGLAIFRSNGNALIVSGTDGSLIAEIPPTPLGTRSGCFSIDRERVLIGYDSGHMQWHSATTGKPLGQPINVTSSGPVDHVFHLKTGQQSITIALSGDRRARAWAEDGKELWTEPLLNTPRGAALSPDHTKIAVGTAQGQILLIDTKTGKPIASLQQSTGEVNRLQFSANNQFLASNYITPGATVWTSEGQLVRHFDTDSRAEGLALSPDGQNLLLAEHSGKVTERIISTGELLWTDHLSEKDTPLLTQTSPH